MEYFRCFFCPFKRIVIGVVTAIRDFICFSDFYLATLFAAMRGQREEINADFFSTICCFIYKN